MIRTTVATSARLLLAILLAITLLTFMLLMLCVLVVRHILGWFLSILTLGTSFLFALHGKVR